MTTSVSNPDNNNNNNMVMTTTSARPNPDNNMITTTTTGSVAALRSCPVTENTWNFTNGYLFNTSNVQINGDGTATGNPDENYYGRHDS